MVPRHFSRRSNRKGGNNVYRCRNLMPRKQVSTKLQDLMLKVVVLLDRCVRIPLDNYVGHDQRTGDEVLSGPDERHPNLRVPIDHRFDLLRMNLEAPNVDGPIPPPGEIVAVTPQFEHIAGVNKTICFS